MTIRIPGMYPKLPDPNETEKRLMDVPPAPSIECLRELLSIISELWRKDRITCFTAREKVGQLLYYALHGCLRTQSLLPLRAFLRDSQPNSEMFEKVQLWLALNGHTADDVLSPSSLENLIPSLLSVGGRSKRSGRRKRQTSPRKLTSKQVEAFQHFSENGGNYSKGARAMGQSVASFRQHVAAAFRKVGSTLNAPKTRAIPHDSRGTAMITSGKRPEPSGDGRRCDTYDRRMG